MDRFVSFAEFCLLGKQLKLILFLVFVYAFLRPDPVMAEVSLHMGLGYYAEANQATSNSTGSTANLQSEAAESVSLKVDWSNGGKSEHYWLRQDLNFIHYTNDPSVNLGFGENLQSTFLAGFNTSDTTIETWALGAHLGAKEFVFYSPDNFYSFGLDKVFVPVIGADLLVRPFFFGAKTRLAAKFVAEYLAPGNRASYQINAGSLFSGSVQLENIGTGYSTAFEIGTIYARQSTTLASYSLIQNLLKGTILLDF